MSFSPLFYGNSVFYMCVVCLLSFVDFNKNLLSKKMPHPYPPPPDNSELQEILIISHALVYNNIWFTKYINITLMSTFIKKLTLSQITNAITPTILKRWLHLLKRSFHFPYSLLA